MYTAKPEIIIENRITGTEKAQKCNFVSTENTTPTSQKHIILMSDLSDWEKRIIYNLMTHEGERNHE